MLVTKTCQTWTFRESVGTNQPSVLALRCAAVTTTNKSSTSHPEARRKISQSCIHCKTLFVMPTEESTSEWLKRLVICTKNKSLEMATFSKDTQLLIKPHGESTSLKIPALTTSKTTGECVVRAKT